MGTLGGSIANNDPAADWPAGVLGLNATVNTNRRSIPADQFFTGMYETALAADEIITSVAFPVPAKAAYVKFPNPASRFALVGVFVARLADGSVRVAVTGRRRRSSAPSPSKPRCRQASRAEAARAVKIDAERLVDRPARLARLSRAPHPRARLARGRRDALSAARPGRRAVGMPDGRSRQAPPTVADEPPTVTAPCHVDATLAAARRERLRGRSQASPPPSSLA